MLNKFMYDQTKLGLIHKSLDTYALRQQTAAHNIANANTHGFKRQEVTFENELRQALKYENGVASPQTSEGHFQIGYDQLNDVKAQAYFPDDDNLHSGVNNIDIDEEMVRLAKAQLSFDFSSRFARRTFSSLRTAIKGETMS
jgi:flagellar basal-body rod protein FlgB